MARGVIQSLTNHSIDTFVAISSPQLGQFGGNLIYEILSVFFLLSLRYVVSKGSPQFRSRRSVEVRSILLNRNVSHVRYNSESFTRTLDNLPPLETIGTVRRRT